METIICGICRRTTPAALKNEHHVRPQHAGGGAGDLTSLCSGCHHSLHRIADMLAGPRASQAEDTARTYYGGDVACAQRCIALAQEDVKWRGARTDGRAPQAAHEEVDLAITVPLAIKSILVQLGRDARDPATGRRLGIAGVARKLLVDTLLQKYPAVRDELARSAQSGRQARGPEPSAQVMRNVRGKR